MDPCFCSNDIITVVAGLDPAIHLSRKSLCGQINARVEPGHDERGSTRSYASPSVSNIAALMASAVVLPAQTTNWNAG
jgi:hypothetical protein